MNFIDVTIVYLSHMLKYQLLIPSLFTGKHTLGCSGKWVQSLIAVVPSGWRDLATNDESQRKPLTSARTLRLKDT